MIAVRDRRDAWVGPSSRPEMDYERALGWQSKGNSFKESEMALFYECMLKCAPKLLDTADIVREAMLRQLHNRILRNRLTMHAQRSTESMASPHGPSKMSPRTQYFLVVFVITFLLPFAWGRIGGGYSKFHPGVPLESLSLGGSALAALLFAFVVEV